jgi:hypothetical protein
MHVKVAPTLDVEADEADLITAALKPLLQRMRAEAPCDRSGAPVYTVPPDGPKDVELKVKVRNSRGEVVEGTLVSATFILTWR